MIQPTQQQKGRAFKELHTAPGVFLMPNAWNAGSAVMLEQAGFAAIGTTSAGIAYSLGLPDSTGALARDTALLETQRIVAGTCLPVSVDGENGYGHYPEQVAECIKLFADTGAVGASIEDYSGDADMGLYDQVLAMERIQAATAAAQELDILFTITARAECFWTGHSNPMSESIERLNRYREAGADCLYAPGMRRLDEIDTLVKEVNGPINVVMGLAGAPVTVAALEQLGVKRISIGGSLARATFKVMQQAAQEMFQNGTFTYANAQVSDAELCDFFSRRLNQEPTSNNE